MPDLYKHNTTPARSAVSYIYYLIVNINMSKELYFITGNKNKLNEARTILGMPDLQNIELEPDPGEKQALYARDVVEKKVMDAYKQLREQKTIDDKAFIFVEDTGLHIKAWNDHPGALIKWLVKAVGTEGICRQMKDYPVRDAYAETCIGYTGGDGTNVKVFSGRVDGIIVDAPRGQTKFAWDPILQPNGHNKTFAEMGIEEKNNISHRKKAFDEFKEFLDLCELNKRLYRAEKALAHYKGNLDQKGN